MRETLGISLVRFSTKSLKHFPRSDFSAEFKSLVADGERGFGFGLLSADTNAIAVVGGNTEVRPLQVHDITDTKSCQTREQRGRFENRDVARCCS